MASKRWLEVTIDVLNPGNLSLDDIAGLIGERYQKPVVQMEGALKLYFESAGHVELSDLEATLEKLGVSAEISISSFDDRAWEEEWKKHLKPLRIGRSILVRPSWVRAEAGVDGIEIVIDPGMAFGTGHHETTRLCLEWLDRFCATRDVKNLTLADVGTGSGILAIAAAKSGFCSVVALDIDSEAVGVAAKNLSLNGLRDRVFLIAGDVNSIRARFDVIIANIQADVLRKMAPGFTSIVHPESLLVLSGILNHQCEDLIESYKAHGFSFQASASLGEWCLVVFKPSFRVS